MTDNNPEDIIDIPPENIVENGSPAGTPRQPRSKRNLALVATLVAVSVAAGGWLYRDVLSNFLPTDQMNIMAARIDSLETLNATLNKKVDAIVGFNDEMESKIEAAQAQGVAVLKLQSEISQNKSEIAALQKSLKTSVDSMEGLKSQLLASGSANGDVANPALILRLDGLEKDFNSLKQGAGTKDDTAVLSQSLSDLRAKIAAGTGFQSEIARIKIMVPAAEGLDFLEAQADTGIPNAAGLAVELRNLLPQLQPAPSKTISSDSSWWSYAANLASGIITVKTIGSADWNSAASQAIAASEQGDLATAISLLEKVDSAMPAEIQKWHDRASARVAIEQALEKVSGAVMRDIAAKGQK